MSQHGQWYRLVTARFLHADYSHVSANCAGLLELGLFLEKRFGAQRLLLIYGVSGMSGALLTHMFLPNVASLGASGAIFGLLGASSRFAAPNRHCRNLLN